MSMSEEPTTNAKPVWKSKTFWAGLVVAIAPLVPEVSSWITEYPQEFSTILGVVFTFLRFITKDKVSII